MSIGKKIVVLSANCKGLQNKNKQMDLTTCIKLKLPSLTPRDESNVRSLWKGDCVLNGFSSNFRGVTILFNTNFEYKLLSVYKDKEGNMISLDINIGEISVKLINLYGPNNDSPEFYSKVK